MLEIIRDPAKQAIDKMRLFIIFFLGSSEDLGKADVEEYLKALQESGCDTSSFEYCKTVRMYSKLSVQQNERHARQQSSIQTANSPANDLLGTFSSNFSRLTDTIQNSGVTGHFETLISGVKNLLPIRKELAVTRIVDLIMEGSAGVEEFQTIDPKLPRNSKKPKQMFQDAIVFVAGGGNYFEYQNLQEYASRSVIKRQIVYGSTDIITSEKFIKQLEVLGRN